MVKRSSTRKVKEHLPQHASTMERLTDWYVTEFERLGWMILARAKGYDFKLTYYRQAIDHLLKSIEHAMTEYKDPDRVHDLKVLHRNTMVLKNFVAKHL